MNQILKKQIDKTFLQTLQDLKNTREKELFLKDFLNDEEFDRYTKRLAIAYWLKKGRDKTNIKNNLEVTDKEIDQVEKKLKTAGFKLAIKYLKAEEWANVWSKKIKKLVR